MTTNSNSDNPRKGWETEAEYQFRLQCAGESPYTIRTVLEDGSDYPSVDGFFGEWEVYYISREGEILAETRGSYSNFYSDPRHAGAVRVALTATQVEAARAALAAWVAEEQGRPTPPAE